MNRYILDACALIAFFNGEKGAELVYVALGNNNGIYISIVNVYEIYYDMYRRGGEEKANELLAEIEKLPLTIIEEVNRDVIKYAAFFKVNFSISLADSIVLGLGKYLKASIVTADHHKFDSIEDKKMVNFYWIR